MAMERVEGGIVERVLRSFPAHTHAMTVVADPDGLLADEGVAAALAERGFTIIAEDDPVHQRHWVEMARPFTPERPVIVVGNGPLESLPYDLWAASHRVRLGLDEFFPHLALPVVRALTPAQRARLAAAPAPRSTLGRLATQAYVLRHVFGFDPAALRRPGEVIGWLNRYHAGGGGLPSILAEQVVAQLRDLPGLVEWPLRELLAGRDAFAAFVQEQWLDFVGRHTGLALLERPLPYVVGFDDPALQDALPALLRSGALEPARLPTAAGQAGLPSWARPGVLAPGESSAPRRFAELLADVQARLGPPAGMRWEQWQAVARAWAELTALHDANRAQVGDTSRAAYRQAQAALDESFLTWLRGHYAPLGAQALPEPHHVFHVPHAIAFWRRQNAEARDGGRVALLVLDGLSLADWHVVGGAWRARHAGWRFEERLALAQIPTITAISRLALITGRRPADLLGSPGGARGEEAGWRAFWAREGLPPSACAYVHLASTRAGALGEVRQSAGTAGAPSDVGLRTADLGLGLDDPRLVAVCLVDDALDEIAHGATQGAAGAQATLRVWLDRASPQLEGVIAGLLARGFALYVTSDHGHVEARGTGQPSEGVTVQTRGRRARLYDDERFARSVQQGFPDTILWGPDGLLPPATRALLPRRRAAFARHGELVVTHGGPTLDEVVVPLATITSGHGRAN